MGHASILLVPWVWMERLCHIFKKDTLEIASWSEGPDTPFAASARALRICSSGVGSKHT
jgi:hypothetical protein